MNETSTLTIALQGVATAETTPAMDELVGVFIRPRGPRGCPKREGSNFLWPGTQRGILIQTPSTVLRRVSWVNRKSPPLCLNAGLQIVGHSRRVIMGNRE